MKKWIVAFVAVPALLVGCGEKEESITPAQEEFQLPNVDILTPKEVSVNEKIELAAHVTQGLENVDDADVQFEVWESGKRDESQMLAGVLDQGGVYKADVIFDHDGVYFMYAHTTANAVHVMPKQQIIAGTPDMTQVLSEEDATKNTVDNSTDASEHREHEENESDHK